MNQGSHLSNLSSFKLDAGFLTKYKAQGPRYTSYPPAPHFNENFKLEDWSRLLKNSNLRNDNISIYVHIPFCAQRCSYCGCNTRIGSTAGFLDIYQNALHWEMDQVLGLLTGNRTITQIHFGGGTPNSVPIKFLNSLLYKIRSLLNINENAEIAIECHPGYLSTAKLKELSDIGFNRISMGVQDFNPQVLKNVNRQAAAQPVKDLVSAARVYGFRGINLDFIYGLPGQTEDSFKDTMDKAIAADPDRIVTFGYAHVPWQMEHQKELETLGLPDATQRAQMAANSHNILIGAGYVPIGMDHFAKPDDDLAVALFEGKLHRNFQGYCTRKTTGQVYAFGASAISQLHYGYGQNRRDPSAYVQSVTQKTLPVKRAYFMTEDNVFFKEVINGIMCRGSLNRRQLAEKFNMDDLQIREKLTFTAEKVLDFEEDGLLEINEDGFVVTPKGWFAVRNIAMACDPLLEENKGRYSQTV